MTARMVITLIGYRGTGKTTVAVPLAERLGWKAIDADVEIERRAGKSIRRIFEEEGEPEFRRWERDVMADLLQQDRLIIAAGGGAILNAETRRGARRAGLVVWLRASVDAIERRMSEDGTTADRRPALTSASGRREIESVLALREPLYRECASLTIETDDLAPDEIVDRIVAHLGEHSGEESRA